MACLIEGQVILRHQYEGTSMKMKLIQLGNCKRVSTFEILTLHEEQNYASCG
jgi:hypothetical protein